MVLLPPGVPLPSPPTGGKRGRGGLRRTSAAKLDTRSAKIKAIDYIETGLTVEAAMAKVDRSVKTWEYWRRNDEDFREKANLAMSTRKVDNMSREGFREAAKAMGFAAWRMKYLGVPTYWHQLQWIDLIEGREPRDLHSAETFEPGRRGRLLCNTPPNHSKSTTITIDYPVYRICCDPSIRIALVSETEGMAKKFLAEIKDKLSQPQYAKLIQDFAPEGGFRTTAEIWSTTQIKVADRTQASKDPTVEALGIGGQIYGARLDLIVVDDAINGGNASQWQSQMDWLRREVLSRPGPAGRVIIVGTRIAPHDLYGQLVNPNNFGGKKSPWTYLAQPAILEQPSENNPEGKTLWPHASIPWVEPDGLDVCELCDGTCHEPIGEADGLPIYPRWDMTHLVRGPKEDSGDERSWQIIYQQRAIPEDSSFPEHAVMASVNNRRRWGLEGGLDSIPAGCYMIGSLDPATSGNAFGIVYAVDRSTKQRYVVDAVNLKAPAPETLKQLIKRWSIEYAIKEWRIEKTGLLTMFTQDSDLNLWLASRGIRFTRHYTGKNKWDTDFGVASLSGLFGSFEKIIDGEWKAIPNTRLIELPRLDTSGLKLLVNQLINWTPDLDPNKVPCDAVMALWFAEIGARDILRGADTGMEHFGKSRFHNPRQLARRQVVDLNDWANREVG